MKITLVEEDEIEKKTPWNKQRFKNYVQDQDRLIKEKRLKDRAENRRELNWRTGRSRPMSENKDCSLYLGVHIAEIHVAERVLSYIYENVEKMPISNPGFDFICGNRYKIDVKSSRLRSYYSTILRSRYGKWEFHIMHNEIADYFLLIGFNNEFNGEELKPMKIWLVSKDAIIRWKEFWDRETIQVKNIHKELLELEEYELKKELEKFMEYCEK